MLQIGIHYTDVLEYLMGPIMAVRGQLAQLVLPGDNPDVASLLLEHENGALSTLNASYASASEYYLMNIYGKDATAYYDLHGGLRVLRRGETDARRRALREERHASSRSWRNSPPPCAARASSRSAASTARARWRSCAPASCRRARGVGWRSPNC